MRNILVPVFAALACTAVPAIAAEPTPVEIAVSYADIDLSDPADVAVLKARIETAARTACTRETTSTLTGKSVDARCAADLQTAAFEKVELIRSKNFALAD